MRRLIAGLLVASALTVSPPAAAGEPVKEQWRSYWVDSFNAGIYNPAQVDQLVTDALAVNANALVVQVGRWQDCFCNRSTYPKTHVPVDPAPYDPLDRIIEKAHAAGIEVHAWVNVAPMWHLPAPPANPNHVFNTHGPTATGADRWLNRRYDGAEIVDTFSFMDPGNPAAVDYIVNGVTSVAREYEVDGINLDFIRYPDYSSQSTYGEWGYTETALRRFRALTGRTDTPAPSDPQWSQWRRDQVTNIMRRIYLGVFAEKPKARVSIDGIVYEGGPQSKGGWENTRTYREVMQDWRGWLDEGILDTTIAMNYKRENRADQYQMYREWNEYIADHQYGRQNVVGPATYLNTVPHSVTQAREALKPTAAGNTVIGWSGYSYAGPTLAAYLGQAPVTSERAALVSALTTEVFTDKAAVPKMPWKERPTTGNIVGTLRLADRTPLDQVAVTARHLVTGQRVTGRLTDGSGWFGFADLTPGVWLVEARLPHGVVGKHLDAVVVTRGGIATANLAPLVRPRR